MNIELRHDEWGKLVLVDPLGQTHVGVDPVRAFPISAPEGGISVLGADGREVLWIEDLATIPPAMRKILDDELGKRHFLPTIARIAAIEGLTETVWTVETDRGATRFTLKNEEDVRRVAGTRVIITDKHSLRYLIPDFRTLDAASLKLLERYI